MSASAVGGRTLLEHGVIDVVTGTGDLQLVTRIYICGDIVRWVGRGVLSLSEIDRSAALDEHFNAVDAAAPASKVASLVAFLSVVERARTALWVLAGLGGSLVPLMVVLWGDTTLGWTGWGKLLSPLTVLALPALRHLTQRLFRWWLTHTMREVWGELVDAE